MGWCVDVWWQLPSFWGSSLLCFNVVGSRIGGSFRRRRLALASYSDQIVPVL